MVENAQLRYMYCYTSAYICKYDFLKYRIALPKAVRNINHFFHNSWNVILFFFLFQNGIFLSKAREKFVIF